MASCQAAWNSAVDACRTSLGWDYWQPSKAYPSEIAKVCRSEDCQKLATEWNRQIATNCTPGAEYALAQPDELWNKSYCASVPGTAAFDAACSEEWKNASTACDNDAGTSSASGDSATAADRKPLFCATPSCVALASVAKKQSAKECPRIVDLVGYTSSSYCSTTVPSSPTPSSSSSDSAAQTTTGTDPTTGSSHTTTIIGVSVASVVGVLLLVLLAVVVRRRRRRRGKQDEDETKATTGNNAGAYAACTPRTEPPTTGAMWGGIALQMVRIPYDKLQFGAVISHGGFGEVSHGFYNGHPVAIKRLLPSRRRDPHNVESFFNEIQLTSTLDHECIVRFLGVAWDAPSNLCMVTEFVGGGDLRSLLSSYAKRLAPHGFDHEKIHIAVQVAHALTYLHSLQPVVVHRDLKSRNILLTENRDAKLIDFGVSTEQRDLTLTAGVGTSLWMAPEVMMGERYDAKADVFSFGVVLSELDTHELPYAHAHEATSSSSSGRKMPDLVVMQHVAQGKLVPRFTEHADPAIVALARACLAVQPALRPTAADALYRLHTARARRSVA